MADYIIESLKAGCPSRIMLVMEVIVALWFGGLVLHILCMGA